jgi:two-component system, NarL family, sensor histidine kinase DegS
MNLPSSTGETAVPNVLEKLREECHFELEQTQKELREIGLMMEQSRLEVTKLQQRNASISAHLSQIQGQIDLVPKSDIRTAYDSALDAQQRLFVMRGQIEKLQSDQAHLERHVKILEQVELVLGTDGSGEAEPQASLSSMAKAVEMIIQAQETERARLARSMHDGPAQALSNFILQTEIAMRLFDVDSAKAKEELSNVKATASMTFQKVRDFIFDLRPMMLDDLGLAPTITRYIETYKEHTGIDVKLVSTGMEQRFEGYLEVMVFRAIQELLTNIARYSQATQVKLQMDSSEAMVKISLEDNGKGFDVEKAAAKSGMGLKVIKDRVQMLGGTFDINSAIGQGTHILLQIPANQAAFFA